ncbi:hypothetical protein NDA13_001402 [Ustilago tritici]|nr:hypothetical protein NDA13_001402 [Ustilago tritici]
MKGKAMSAKNVSQALVIQNTSTFPPHTPDNIVVSAGLFCLDEVTANPAKAVETGRIFTSTSLQTKATNDAQQLDFLDNPLAKPPEPINFETILVDNVFQVGQDTQGQPHPSIVTVLHNNLDAFLLDGRPGHISDITMQLKLAHPDTLHPKAPHRVSPDKHQVIDDTLDQLLGWDVIEPSNSPVSYPVLLIKQGAKWRLLDCLLKAARKVGLKFSPAKCHFALSSLTLLGQWISTQGISVLVNHTQAIQTLTPPATLQGLHHMMGLFSYYCNFIPNYAGLTTPLTNLLQGHKYQHSTKGTWQLVDADGKTTKAMDIKINWGTAQDKALANLKAAFSSLPTLVYPDFNHLFLLYIDASQQAFAAALHQQLPLSDSDSTKNKLATATPAEANNLDIPPTPTH